METGGWISMILSLGFVLILASCCYYRVLTKPESTEHMHTPLEIDTHDLDNGS